MSMDTYYHYCSLAAREALYPWLPLGQKMQLAAVADDFSQHSIDVVTNYAAHGSCVWPTQVACARCDDLRPDSPSSVQRLLHKRNSPVRDALQEFLQQTRRQPAEEQRMQALQPASSSLDAQQDVRQSKLLATLEELEVAAEWLRVELHHLPSTQPIAAKLPVPMPAAAFVKQRSQHRQQHSASAAPACRSPSPTWPGRSSISPNRKYWIP